MQTCAAAAGCLEADFRVRLPLTADRHGEAAIPRWAARSERAVAARASEHGQRPSPRPLRAPHRPPMAENRLHGRIVRRDASAAIGRGDRHPLRGLSNSFSWRLIKTKLFRFINEIILAPDTSTDI